MGGAVVGRSAPAEKDFQKSVVALAVEVAREIFQEFHRVFRVEDLLTAVSSAVTKQDRCVYPLGSGKAPTSARWLQRARVDPSFSGFSPRILGESDKI